MTLKAKEIKSMDHSNPELPKIADGKIPAWIKWMWAFAVVWIGLYIYFGLRSGKIS